MKQGSFSKWLEGFQDDLSDQRNKELELPVYDKIDVHALQIFRNPSKSTSSPSPLAQQTKLAKEFGFVFAQKQLVEVNIPQQYRDQGLIICDLATAWLEHQELFSKYFAQLISPREDRLTYEHYRHLSGGVLIYVPDNLAIKETLQAYFEYPADSQSLQIILILGEQAKLSITENQLSAGVVDGDYTIFGEIYADVGSTLAYVVNDQAKTTGHNYFYRRFVPQNRAIINLTSGEFTEGNVLVSNKITLAGNDTVGEVKTVAIAQKDQICAINSRVTNQGLRTRGNILQHGVILDRAKLIFNGVGQIIKGSRGSDSQQENRVLMLSANARGDANPILLIDENDVTAGHAASVGRIDEEQLYYLESRGLSADIAKRLIIRGFLESVITVVESRRTQKMLRSVIERSLAIDS